MKRKQLEAILQRVDGFEQPKVKLEQYVTSADVATSVLTSMNDDYEDIAGRTILDLGSGTGTLSIGSSALGADFVVGVELDEEAIRIARENVEQFDGDFPVEFVLADVEHLPFRESFFDVVVTNPPFGTKNNAGTDLGFVSAGLKLAPVVYSLHKTSTRRFVEKRCKELGAKAVFVAELRYDLPKTYKFHKRDCVDVSVDFVRIEKLK